MDTKRNIPTVFVIFGATGDLMQKKIAPALYHLFKKGKLPKLLRIIGFSRRDLSDDEFKRMVLELLKKHKDIDKNEEEFQRFSRHLTYQSGDFNEASAYKKLATDLGRIDGEWKVCSNKLFYLAVPPSYYESILKNLHDSGLTIPCSPQEGWTRVIVEKPFGKDLQDAKNLDLLLGKLFKEEQVYRIDHYVGKEMLQNILSFRFSNNLLEESWNNKFVEKIEVRVYEEGGVEGRESFYDGLGALRDVGQNHILQMLGFITMDNPGSLTTERLRAKKTEVLKAVEKIPEESADNYTFRGQYEGYQGQKGVWPNSQTETYFKIKTHITNSRWRGVPIFLESGKHLPEGKKEIIVTFKHPSPCFCPPSSAHLNNKVVFQIEPKMEIDIRFLSKKPGLAMYVEERNFNFTYHSRHVKNEFVEEYEKLLIDCIEGNQMLFISTSEIAAEWEFIDPIIGAWEKNKVPLILYKPKSWDAVQKADGILNKLPAQGRPVTNREIGIIGLGKMGSNIARALIEKGWSVHGINRSGAVTKAMENEGLKAAFSFKELVAGLKPPRILWIMLTAGDPVEHALFYKDGLSDLLQKGDIVIDAGNSFYKDAIKRGETLKKSGIQFVDVGVSGGPAGARAGACLMVGGDKETFEYLLPLFTDLAVPQGVSHFEGAGAGHFVKMVHNGIEYGMMQAIAEGFNILKHSSYKLDLKKVVDVYNNGSVIESRLTKWLQDAFELYGQDLKEISGKVGYTGEGEWTAQAAKELNLTAKIIEESFNFRVMSQKKPDFAGRLVSAMRNQFGGHPVR